MRIRLAECAMFILGLFTFLTANAEDGSESHDENPDAFKTRPFTLEAIDESEFPETWRHHPEIVNKLQTEHLAANNKNLLLPYRANYFMPLTYQTKINQEEQEAFYGRDGVSSDRMPELDHVEFVFQLSVKYIITDHLFSKWSALSVAYTNKSFWQAYNSNVSAVFRETNHEPEIILGFYPDTDWFDYAEVAFNHQSNGQAGSLSRSWNRIVFRFAKVWPDQILALRPWWRIPEERKDDPLDPEGDDNPDIDDYLGNGELFYLKNIGSHSIGATLRNNLNFDSENRGSVELDWTFPLRGNLRGFVQYFNGYGESLIDYNQYQERIGVGIKISGWL